jgi:4-hydroxybenzoate polyprenyltransferase
MLNQKLKSYAELMRLHKPIGILLLLWPTLWALWIAGSGRPSIKNCVIFVAGVILMRSAGCIINDFADRKYDPHVSRTHTRPIATGVVSPKEAIVLFLILCLLAFILVLFTNFLTIILSVFAVITAFIYPFMKRYTHWPQLILGIAFSFSIPMAFTAETNHLPMIAFIMMAANILWTIAYDTQYAMVDRSDDLKIGIKSTAILFGNYDLLMIGLFQGVASMLLFLIGFLKSLSIYYFFGIIAAIALFAYQYKLTAKREPTKCFTAFLNNQWVGCVIFIGILLSI